MSLPAYAECPVEIGGSSALEERLKRTGLQAKKAALIEDMEAMQRRLSALPVLDHRSPDDIIGYDENGLPT
ncbi:type II toxin-antitoxin system VapB family antitoxin [Shinella sp.]|uniref:type II toxin-antitoxin system VapB family antitoxin n=1 Tax=Shinella sp. TaxID=1870904 RepID=UPI003F6FCDAC